jgi:membrane fusion protein (multidrug efflux system)
LQLIDGTIYDQKGKIDAVSGVIDQTTGSVSMRAIFPNDKNILRSGGTGNIIFPYQMEDIILIPQNATQEIQNLKFVYVVGADNKVVNTMVTISPFDDGKNYVVTDGLKPGDRIVIEGVRLLQNGQEIKPITKAEQQAKFQKALQDTREGNIRTAF